MSKSLIAPPFLKAGDTVGVLAPASKIDYEDCLEGLRILREDWKLNVVEGATLKSQFYQFSGTDELRRQDLQSMLDNPEIKAILAVRGGYGCSRMMDQLDFSAFRQSPKWLVGFSDLTALLAHFYTIGYASIHGPMVKLFAKENGEIALESLRKALFGEPISYVLPAHAFNRLGEGFGPVVGGNLCLLAHLTGSVWEVDMAGKILFIEDINEYLYSIDRMMIQLKRAGQLENLSGLLVGQFSDVRDNPEPVFGKEAYEIIQEHTSNYNYPICYDFPTGHVADNRALPIGLTASLAVLPGEVRLDYSLIPKPILF
ncbi:S66 peptidase family protein [Arundinibacter roseus]|uniref:LD-carboxypeptidase n=1 Tax=Arundinibacter roseus TaxID=2070510 RepID=A0A4R4KFA5_9BACT|nr:LD-carboxypeptidase [Arundinibacter roseus]TDB65169.1 LD-carboxypeptidase [Arundinibacter roseus]